MNPSSPAPGQQLPPHGVIARNGATQSENRIHADSEAQAHGFRGGLVPGITTFGYMTRPVIDAFGLAWLDRGRASIRLRRPVYEGDSLLVCGTVATADTEGVTVDVTIAGQDEVKAVGTAILLARTTPLDPSAIPRAPLPAVPPAVSREVLSAMPVLGSIEMDFDAASTPMFEIDDDPTIYRDAGVAHPALLLGAANMILAANVALGPWIHVASEMCLCGRVRDGDHVSVRGKVDRLFERQGREFVDLSVLVVTNDRDAVVEVKHTAIYGL
jgi:acyl dehydratase